MSRKYFGGYPKSKHQAVRNTVLKIMGTMSGLSDHEECPHVDSMIEQGLTQNEIYQLQSLLDKVWNTTPAIEAIHNQEGTFAHFDRYIAGDR
jgi:hypothetical protein